ncbi:MAG: DUF1797 family protein [Atopococcus tabaci]|uniref:DUF1797 family protein n=1 Tax=Atopococcus tabaci TaxID=269774 RepID=A0AA43ZS91_9LACT|nr:DUF1797 family protein [Atopococcus tabaci]
MTESYLSSIIDRLIAMTKDESDDIQRRLFEFDGRLIVKVFYNKISGVFTVVNAVSYENFKFELLDLAAIEIFEILYEYRAIYRNHLKV